MRDLLGLSPGLIVYNVGYLILVWALALGAIALFWAWPHWYTFLLAFLVVSSRFQALLNIEHEAIHRKFVPTRRGNDLIGRYLAAAPAGSPYGASRKRHLTHHRLLATPEDPDHDLHAAEGLKSKRGVVRHFVGGLLGGYAGMVLLGPPAPRSSRSAATPLHDLGSLVIVQLAIFGGLTLAFDWWVYPALWLAPLVTITVLFHLIRSFAEHAITAREEPEHGNRLITIRSNLLERSLVAPYFMNYHAEHHIMPTVPAPRLRALQAKLADRPDAPPVLHRSSYGAALRHYLQGLGEADK